MRIAERVIEKRLRIVKRLLPFDLRFHDVMAGLVNVAGSEVVVLAGFERQFAAEVAVVAALSNLAGCRSHVIKDGCGKLVPVG